VEGERSIVSPGSKPNDMAISADESRLYLSGMNYDADPGDLWFYDITQKSLHNIDLSGTDPKLFRTNGIEL
jgi:sugar lactone lactonase YvrE